MSFPNFPEKFNGLAVMKPADTIAMRQRFGQFPKMDAPKSMIFCMKNNLPHQLRWRVPIKYAGRIMGDMYLVKRSKGKVGVISNFGIGAPVVVSLAEELIAWGVERFVMLSWGGGLQKDLQCGDIIVNDKAIRDEGVSHHYLPTEKYAVSDESLSRKIESSLLKAEAVYSTGCTWTTDAPYRETHEEISLYQSEGVKVVEMEIAGLFALAQARNVQAASIVVVADLLANLTWEMPSDMKKIDRSFETAYRAAIAALMEDA